MILNNLESRKKVQEEDKEIKDEYADTTKEIEKKKKPQAIGKPSNCQN